MDIRDALTALHKHTDRLKEFELYESHVILNYVFTCVDEYKGDADSYGNSFSIYKVIQVVSGREVSYWKFEGYNPSYGLASFDNSPEEVTKREQRSCVWEAK